MPTYAPGNKHIRIEWETSSEIDDAGFNIWRAEGFKQINDNIIPAKGYPTVGADYDFVDDMVLNRKTYYYLLEDIDLNGLSTFHGPVQAVPRKIYGGGD